MIVSLLLTMMVAQAPLELTENERVLVLNLKLSEVSEAEGELMTGRVATTLESMGISVVTVADLKELVDLQADKQMLDEECDTSGCLSEIANAMGTRFVVSGRIGSIGDVHLLQLAIHDTQKASVVGRKEVEAQSLSALSQKTPAAVRSLFGQEENAKSFPWLFTSGAALTGVGVLGAVGLGLTANFYDGVVLDSEASADDKAQAKTRGLAALGGVVVSGVVAVVGVSLMGVSLFKE